MQHLLNYKLTVCFRVAAMDYRYIFEIWQNHSMSSITHDDGFACLRDNNSELLAAQEWRNCSNKANKKYSLEHITPMVPICLSVGGIMNNAPSPICLDFTLVIPHKTVMCGAGMCLWMHLKSYALAYLGWFLFIDTFTHLTSHLSMSAPHPNPSFCQHFISFPSNTPTNTQTYIHSHTHTHTYTCVSANTAVIGKWSMQQFLVLLP